MEYKELIANPTKEEAKAAIDLCMSVLEFPENTHSDVLADLAEHALVLIRCLELYAERNAQYHSLWKDAGWPDCLNNVVHKVRRQQKAGEWATRENGGNIAHTDMDTPHDVINYEVFFVRNALAGRNGTDL